MKLITHIRNIIFLWRTNTTHRFFRKELSLGKAHIEIFLKVAKIRYKRKNSWVRNQIAQLIRNIRKEHPYKIRGFSEARKFYENQPAPINFSEVKEGSYVVKHTEEYAVKGKRWCEYHINFTSGLGVFKVGKWKDEYKFFRLENYKCDWGAYSLYEEDAIMFRFATKEEIEQFKIARKNYKQKKKEIDTLQKQITKLYKEL